MSTRMGARSSPTSSITGLCRAGGARITTTAARVQARNLHRDLAARCTSAASTLPTLRSKARPSSRQAEFLRATQATIIQELLPLYPAAGHEPEDAGLLRDADRRTQPGPGSVPGRTASSSSPRSVEPGSAGEHGAAAHQGPDDRRRLRQAACRSTQLQRRGLDRRHRVAVAVAAVAEEAPGLSRRSRQAARPGSPARTCSMKSSRPPGFSTRAISASAAAGSGTVQSTRVATAVSKLASSKGSRSRPLRDELAAASGTRPARAQRSPAMWGRARLGRACRPPSG